MRKPYLHRDDKLLRVSDELEDPDDSEGPADPESHVTVLFAGAATVRKQIRCQPNVERQDGEDVHDVHGQGQKLHHVLPGNKSQQQVYPRRVPLFGGVGAR